MVQLDVVFNSLRREADNYITLFVRNFGLWAGVAAVGWWCRFETLIVHVGYNT